MPQIAYPDLVTNTGYDASHFLYSDTVHVTGTITDSGAGIAVSGSSTPPSPNFEMDGIAVGSGTPGTAVGPNIAIPSCTDAQTSCSFSADVKLSDLTKVGPFHAFDNKLQLVVNSADKAVDAAGNPAGNVGSSSPVQFNVTRLWWKSTLLGGGAVSGLAIHPSGDVVASTAPLSGDTVFALYPNGPLNSATGAPVHWHAGANWYSVGNDLGEIDGAPAIGAAGLVYVATVGADFVAINPPASASANVTCSGNGTVGTNCQAWDCGAGAVGTAFHYTPAVATFAKLGSKTNCEGPLAGADSTQLIAACQLSATSCVNQPAAISAVGTSAAIVSGTTYYVGATTQMAQATINSTTGVFNAATLFPSTPASNSWTQLAFGAGQFYGVNPASGGSRVYEFESNLHSTWDNTTISHAVNGQPVIRGLERRRDPQHQHRQDSALAGRVKRRGVGSQDPLRCRADAAARFRRAHLHGRRDHDGCGKRDSVVPERLDLQRGIDDVHRRADDGLQRHALRRRGCGCVCVHHRRARFAGPVAVAQVPARHAQQRQRRRDDIVGCERERDLHPIAHP